MPKKIKRLWRFNVDIPGSEELIPCDEFFEKYPALLPSFTIANCFGVKLFTEADADEIRAAFEMEKPQKWWPSNVYLFGKQLWELTESETQCTEDEIRLLFLEAVDSERRKFERLKRRFSGIAAGSIKNNREQISEEVRIYVWRRDEGKCVRCGNKEKLEFDHIIPVNKGGSNTERNIQLLCENCNRTKSDKV
jgi:hypothetical protein